MNLRKTDQLVELWQHALENGANVVLMRHAPKAGLDEPGVDNSDLSVGGSLITREYAGILEYLQKEFQNAVFVCTSKTRTSHTLKLLFPFTDPTQYVRIPDLEPQSVSSETEAEFDRLHREFGHWRGYLPQMTYHLLERLGGRYFDKEYLHTDVASRMAKGYRPVV